MLHTTLSKLFFVFSLSVLSCLVACAADWPDKGAYEFTEWAGPSLGVHYSIPLEADATTPILVVIPGAKRNADFYRDAWHDLAMANGFIVLTVQAREADFPTEYDYNAGGVINEKGSQQPEERWLFSAIEPLFDHFKKKFGSQRSGYLLYGHSAGGGFVHRYLLMKPKARVDRAVAANPAFFTMPNDKSNYPFGLGGMNWSTSPFENWFDKRLVILLGDLDRGPRTRELSNGPQARAQGPSVLARGLEFFREALTVVDQRSTKLNWKIEIVQHVGHSNTHMAARAVPYLFAD